MHMSLPPAPAAASPRPAHLAHGARPAPKLLADIGGTNARFALETTPGRLDEVRVLPCADYPTVADALRAYLALPGVAAHGTVHEAGIAIANPVDGDLVRMTNHHWQFSIEALRQACGFERLLLVNDFRAMAMSLPGLTEAERRQVGGGSARHGVIGLLGAGTGLGMASLVPSSAGWIAVDSEGGHNTFAPSDERELDILRFAWRAFPHVSAERLLSGIGIDLIYRALAERAGETALPLSVPEIIARAIGGNCPRSSETVECFCAMLGTVTGNLALTVGAVGGVYVGGGIVPRLGALFDRSAFRQRFEQKGRLADYLAQIPTYVITAEFPGLLGMAALLR